MMFPIKKKGARKLKIYGRSISNPNPKEATVRLRIMSNPLTFSTFMLKQRM